MASDTASVTSHPESKPPMSTAEIVAYVRKELDTDDEHLARVITANSDLSRDAHPSSGVTLDLSHKNIRELPVEVVALIKDKVERLALSHNPQIAVPSQIIQCDRLRYLNLRWNQLKYFPEAILQLSKLEILDISKNRIVGIPEDIKRMTSLKFLAVARNKIKRLPLSLGEMGSLSKLKFDENPIEFPPPDALKLQEEKAGALETEKEKEACLQVKRYLRQAALRERLMSPPEHETSESSNAETPRPPKRGMGMGGRFPVRPSMSGIENISDLKSESPQGHAPPIPKRSHARMSSGTLGLQLQRPGVAPILQNGGETNRSRSDTVSSISSLRTRRQGFVPMKRTVSNNSPSTDLSAVSENGHQPSSRSSQASTLRAAHSRNTSVASTYNGYLAPSSSGEISSGATSPIDGPVNRYHPDRGLGNLMHHPNIKLLKSRHIVASRRLLFTLVELQRPISRIAHGLKEGTPKRTILERQLFNASTHVEDLDRLLKRLDGGFEDTPKREAVAAKNIAAACDNGMKAYSVVVRELKGLVQKIVQVLDPVLTRCLMFQINTAIIEARNVCKSLGFTIVPPQAKQDPRVNRPYSSRTVTPTQPKPITNRRLRGPTILRSISSNATLRAMPPPVPLNANSSRTNTMTSIASATPNTGQSFTSSFTNPNSSFTSANSSAAPSRSNTMRSTHPDDADEVEQFERIFLKLQTACDVANRALPHCHREITVHKDNAETAGKVRAAHYWSLSLTKCNAVIRANQALSSRLKQVRLKDPGTRSHREFWTLCDAFVQTWAELATEVKDIGQQRIDITTIKAVMKPVQRAVKDVSKSVSDSPLYHAALRGGGGGGSSSAWSMTSPAAQSLAPPFQGGAGGASGMGGGGGYNTSGGGAYNTGAGTGGAYNGGGSYQSNTFTTSLNTALQQFSAAAGGGPPTSVPATPLAAALGPAAQATLSYASAGREGEFYPAPSSHSAAPSAGGGAGGYNVGGGGGAGYGAGMGVRGMHERLDTVMQNPGGSAGGYGHGLGGYGSQAQQSQQSQHVGGNWNGNGNGYGGNSNTMRRVEGWR